MVRWQACVMPLCSGPWIHIQPGGSASCKGSHDCKYPLSNPLSKIATRHDRPAVAQITLDTLFSV